MHSASIISSCIVVVGLIASSSAVGSDKNKHGHESKIVAMPENALYQTECGSCHMAYPPGLLPERSWRKLMSSLNNHFGDNAELDANKREAITGFLAANSADKSSSATSRRFAGSSGDKEIVLRITEMPYFIHEHDDIPARLVTGNKSVLSFSNCNACHRNTDRGSFQEDDINIPGYGRWDD